MKDGYVLDFQSLKHDSSLMGETPKVEHKKKGNVFFIGEYGDLCLDLKLESYDVHNVKDISEGVEILLHNANSSTDKLPDVIIISQKITPDSVETIKSLKKSKSLIEIPVIIIAEKFDEEERDLAIKVGAEDYYTDNISAKYLTLRIEFLTRLKTLSNNQEQEVGIKPKPSLHNGDSFKMWSLKRAFDIAISASLLLMVSPILLIIAIAIKIDSKGPIFYISKRAGKGYQIFNFYKFRSMRQDADQVVNDLKHLNQYSNGDDALFFKVKNDPRITKLGSFLRKTSLDELPQLFNVLKGDMSLVGNRPLPLYEAEKLTQDQWALRFLAPAGITGLWQITKRGKEEMSEAERVALDMEYAQKNSFWYDLKIMLKTPAALLQSEDV
ncbi:sugar transferase [Fulvivirga sp. 29W222]|uniref:Sugar transferase n=1 Tax=Fulvivirga marina TaxID=2494733 RepID=A0A937G2P3_9BACT|nr:sugar transferase [Fulvivirga marina]MBL6448890.1 sugar transferase [Fulvivirga marina]